MTLHYENDATKQDRATLCAEGKLSPKQKKTLADPSVVRDRHQAFLEHHGVENSFGIKIDSGLSEWLSQSYYSADPVLLKPDDVRVILGPMMRDYASTIVPEYPEPVGALVQRVRRAMKGLLKQSTQSFIICVTHGYSVQIMTELLSATETVADASYCCISKGFKKLSREETRYLEDRVSRRKHHHQDSPASDSDSDNNNNCDRPKVTRRLGPAPFLEDWTLLSNATNQHYIQLEPTKDVLAAYDRFLAPIHKLY